MWTLPVLLFLAGVAFIAVFVLGGGIENEYVKIPPQIGWKNRVLSLIVGIAFVAGSVYAFVNLPGSDDSAAHGSQNGHGNPNPGPPNLSPYGIELTATADPQKAVNFAEQAKSIAPSGAEIRLYKRRLPQGGEAWAPVVIYTNSSVAANDKQKYEVFGWDPELIAIGTWCPNARQIPSPTGTPLTIPVLDCT